MKEERIRGKKKKKKERKKTEWLREREKNLCKMLQYHHKSKMVL